MMLTEHFSATVLGATIYRGTVRYETALTPEKGPYPHAVLARTLKKYSRVVSILVEVE